MTPLAKPDLEPSLSMPTCPSNYVLLDLVIERNTIPYAGRCKYQETSYSQDVSAWPRAD